MYRKRTKQIPEYSTVLIYEKKKIPETIILNIIVTSIELK